MRSYQSRIITSAVAAMWLTACGSAFAANWDNGEPASDDWTDAANWSGDVLPTGQNTWLDNDDTAVLYAGDSDTVAGFWPGGTAGPDLTIQGTLNTTGRMRIAETAGHTGKVTVDGGTLNVADHFYVGAGGTGHLVVTNGGTVNQTVSGYGFQVPPAWGTGTGTNIVEVVDGTINTLDLYMKSTGLIEMGSAGSIVVDGNEESEIQGYVNSGWIVPIDSGDLISVNYDGTNTTITAGAPIPDGWTGAISSDWTVDGNWTYGSVPTGSIYVSVPAPAVIDSGVTATGVNGYFSGAANTDITIQGTLDLSGLLRIALENEAATLTIEPGGALTVGSYFNVGFKGAGTFVMNGGTLDVGTQLGLPSPYAGANGSAILTLNDGAITADELFMNSAGQINVGSGSIVIAGNELSEIEGYVSSGYIVPIDPLGSIVVEYDGSGDTTTIISEVPTAQILAVDFGADYVAAQINASSTRNGPTTGDYDFDGNDDDTARTVTFGTVFAPSNNASWTTPAGKSGPNLRYGQLVANLDSALDPSDSVTYDRITTGDRVDFSGKVSATSAASMSLASAYYYDKADFLRGQDAVTNLVFDQSSEINILFHVDRHVGEGRALVRNGTQWYVSADALIGTAAIKDKTLTVIPATSDFYAFDPATNLLFNTDTPGTPVAGSTFNDITAVGLHIQHTEYDGTSAFIPYQFWSAFSASVPGVEPSTFSYWADAYGLYNEDLAVLGAGDPDGDGLNTLTEWALDGNPTVSDADTVLQLGMDGSELSLTYKRRLNAGDYGLTYAAEAVTELGDTWTDDDVTEEFSIISVEFEQVTSSVPVDVAKRFMHLEIDADTSVLGPEIDEAAYGIPESVLTTTIDGTIAANEWDDAYHMLLDASIDDGFGNVLYQQDPTAADLSVDCYLKWDATFLYLAFKVTDELMVFGTAHWPNDGLVLAINPLQAGTVATADCVHNEMFRKSDNSTGLTSSWNAALAPTNATAVSTVQAEGYTYEVRYRWSDLGVTPVAGQIHGMVIQVNDKDVNTPDSGAIDEGGTGTILVDGGAVGTASSYRPVVLLDSQP
jgi:T5SS/PEP-CTERM-associated repeat protein